MGYRSRILSAAALGCWKSGLGKAMNLSPKWLGQNLVLSFPGKKAEVVLNYYESDGQIFAILPFEEYKGLEEALLSGCGAEVWMKNGWFTASVRLIPEEEHQQMILPADNTVYGTIGAMLKGGDACSDKLLRITRNAPCTGEDGPGSWSWIWPALCGLLLVTKKGKRK